MDRASALILFAFSMFYSRFFALCWRYPPGLECSRDTDGVGVENTQRQGVMDAFYFFSTLLLLLPFYIPPSSVLALFCLIDCSDSVTEDFFLGFDLSSYSHTCCSLGETDPCNFHDNPRALQIHFNPTISITSDLSYFYICTC